MTRTLLLATTLALGLAGAAIAGMPVQQRGSDSLIIKVAEGCGRDFWRGPGGKCHPFPHGRLCPVGYHLGPHGHRCWPNTSSAAWTGRFERRPDPRDPAAAVFGPCRPRCRRENIW